MNPSTACATVLVDELVRQGVRHAVLCPGSRSAPLAYALREAERAGRLALHVRVDERSAGFLALGLAKLTRVPAVVVTTSGTAVANLHPAVLEAHHGVVPLIVLSADRPAELRGTGANQTTVQPGMFADAVRWSVDAAAPERAPGEVGRWRGLAADAVRHATGAGRVGEPGPVHVNVQLREPLVPTDADGAWPEPLTERRDETAAAGAGGAEERAATTATPVLPAPSTPGPATVELGADAAYDVLREPPRTLVVIGDLPEPGQFATALAWARRHGWPVVAEPLGSYPREGVTRHAPLVVASEDWLDAHAPARVVTVGRVTLSRPVAALLRRPGVRLEAVRAHRWIESAPTVARVWDPDVLGRAADGDGRGWGDSNADDPSPEDLAWSAAWEAAGRTVGAALADGALTPTAGAPIATDGPRRAAGLRSTDVAEVLWREIPSGATLFVGSSSSVRDLDLTYSGRDRELTVTASRGLAGIDGCVSTAVGIALSGAGPTYAWMGDLTFLHDANGLLIGPSEPTPDLTLVVTNDDGGGIFTLLEPGEPDRSRDFERLFATPTGTDLGALCAAHGVVHQRVTSAQELADAVSRAPRGLTVVEVPVDRERHRPSHAEMVRLAGSILG